MLTVISDSHLGVNRTGGTTKESFLALKEYTQRQFKELLYRVPQGNDLLINGDLFDSFNVSNDTVLFAFRELGAWLERSGQMLYLARGNHDTSKDSTKMSSFDMLCSLLDHVSDRVYSITEPHGFDYAGGATITVLPHAPNQDIFNLWIEDQCKTHIPGRHYLFVHANFDNNFAVESDHSLNVSREQIKQLTDAGFEAIIFAHEHQQRQDGRAIIVGNQFPTSVSDCLGNRSKRLLHINASGEMEFEDTWQDAGSYYEADWKRPFDVPECAQFVRLTGEATADEAASVIAAHSALRKKHQAFVITNSVKIDGQVLDTEALKAIEEVSDYSVTDFLLNHLKNDAQRDVVKSLLKNRPAKEQA